MSNNNVVVWNSKIMLEMEKVERESVRIVFGDEVGELNEGGFEGFGYGVDGYEVEYREDYSVWEERRDMDDMLEEVWNSWIW